MEQVSGFCPGRNVKFDSMVVYDNKVWLIERFCKWTRLY